MGTMPNSGSCSLRTGLAVHAAAACVHWRQDAARPTAAAVGLGQHLLLGIAPILSVPISGVQWREERQDR
eukprot:2647220-Pyramimonas_sp.AAC.1